MQQFQQASRKAFSVCISKGIQMKLRSQTVLVLALGLVDPGSPVVIILAMAFFVEIVLAGLLALASTKKRQK